jgi:hypothetical protein
VSRHRPGRVRIALAARLARSGIVVDPADIWCQEGGYRRQTWDLARWGTHLARWASGNAPDGTPWRREFAVSSWSTMGECVRHGVSIGKLDESGTWSHVTVEANL